MLPSEYEDNTLQTKEKSTERTVPFFVQEVTARSVTNILGIVISYHSALTADGVFEGYVELDESYFREHRKRRHGHGVAGKLLSSTF